MRILRILTVVLTWIVSYGVSSADVKWLATDYNFGAFRESEGPKTGSVRFVNVGKEPTFIKSVRPSCGCTAAKFTETMIEPGDTATVSFTYNPAGRPGPFDKTIKVFLGSDNELQVIRIAGTVIGAPETLEINYPYESDVLRFESLSQSMGEVKKGSSRHVFINIYNQGNDTVRPEWKSDGEALSVGLTPKALAPGEIGTFGFYLNTSAEKRMGPVDYVVSVKPDKASAESKKIKVNAVIVPDSRNMSVEDIEKGPRAYLVPEFIDFGENVSGGVIPFEFEVMNEGGSPLEIHRIYSDNGYVDIKSFMRKTKEGKKSKVTGSIDCGRLPSGPFRIQVNVVTNDPLHPLRTANLVGIKM